MRTILSGICLFIATVAFAQRECASSAYIDQLKSADPVFAAKITEIENFVRRQKMTAKESELEAPKVIIIPVVVHVLYKTPAQNISDEQIKTQIEALNRDFRRKNTDTLNTPVRFRSLAADVQIEFALATADDKGRATNWNSLKQSNYNSWIADEMI
jgi:hypothetical protein